MSTRKSHKEYRWYSLGIVLTELSFWTFFLSLYFYLVNEVENFRLEWKEGLYLLVIPVVFSFVSILFFGWKIRARRRFADEDLIGNMSQKTSWIKSFIKYFLVRMALASLIIAIANPQYGKNKKEAISSGIDLMIALDVSNSMMATDMAGDWDRLKIARLAIEKLLAKLHGDRIGMVVFAGDAYTQLPITTDYSAARLFLGTISPGMVSPQGTAIGRAIERSIASFDNESPTNKGVIIISDGENHEDNAIEAAKNAAAENIRVFTVGMGSPEGSPIPVYENGRKTGVKRDPEGNTIITRLNEEMLKEVAEAGEGTYVRAIGTDLGLERLVKEINKIEKTEFTSELYQDYDDQFSFFLLLAIIFLLVDQFISEKENKWFKSLLNT